MNYPIAWQGIKFDPPDTGIWIEPIFLPNDGLDNGLSNTDKVVPQGQFNVIVHSRPGAGIVGVQEAADKIADLYPKGKILAGLVRVSRAPVVRDIGVEKDRVSCVVVVQYSG